MSYILAFLPLTREEIPGAIVVNVFAFLSTFALFSVAFRVIWLAVARFLSNSGDAQCREYVFFNTVLGNYAACLLIANMISGGAGILGVQQLLKGGIQEGTFCDAQAVVMQIGNFGGAYFTMAIGVHTFNSLVLAKRQSALICAITIAIGWTFSCLLAAAPLWYPSGTLGPAYGISGLSCGIREAYPKLMFLFHLLPIYLTSILSALIFSIVFLVLRGTLVIKGGFKLALDPNERWSGNVQNYHRFVARIARSMLWFPVAYILFLVPYSFARLIDLSGRKCPIGLLVAAYVFWFMLGVANVITLYNTFRVLEPAFDARSSTHKDLESNNGSTASRRAMPPMIAAGDRYSYGASESMSEKSRPNSLASFNQVQPAPAENRAAPPFQLRAPPLAARIQEIREQYPEPYRTHSRTGSELRTHSRNDSGSSGFTTNTNAPSFYDYGATSETDAAPRHRTQLSQLLANEPTNGARTWSSPRSSRSIPPPSEGEPVRGLPAPPRSIRSQRSVTTVAPASPQHSIDVRYSSTSQGSSVEETDITGWVNQQRPEGYMPRGLISAVGTAHSVPSIPADAVPVPTGGPRAGSIDRTRSAVASDRKRPGREGAPSRVRGNSVPDRH
ncbi:hypothetical protein B0H15DRAFT_845346 [Mycena belliarum]|uniref:Glucose receptor Git3 N-terminal domain-containing protein n=1 Tax=Mycena belliarum TaxID=1033014 RepID=A0AAD6U6D1_9AGAR|nr:hypothetical protein B0H15DRAFT_845346 [Mycena belliae]